jgi:hypothetical protein
MSEIQPVSSITRTHSYMETVTKVLQSSNGDRVQEINYIVTLYDRGGQIYTTTTTNMVNFSI